MRPKKVILCVDDNEQELSVLKFMLVTNGYRVLSATNGQEAIAIFADNIRSTWCWPIIRCLIWAVTNWLRNSNSSQPTYRWYCWEIYRKIGGQVHGADALLAKKTCTSLELLERVKVMSARKRGPRKGVQRLVICRVGRCIVMEGNSHHSDKVLSLCTRQRTGIGLNPAPNGVGSGSIFRVGRRWLRQFPFAGSLPSLGVLTIHRG